MTGRNPSLDTLRGAAILLVVLVHCAQVTTSVVPGLRPFALQYGEFGVQLFFVVSAYTMMLTFGDRVDPAAAGSFYIRRLFRIVPLFWLAIPVYALLTGGEGFKLWAPDGIGIRDVVLTFFFLQWTSVTAFNSVVPGGWSIAVEMQFYLLFPVILYLFRRQDGPSLCYALIALVSVLGQLAAQQYLIPQLAATLPKDQAYLAEAFYYCWLPQQAICFGCGLLLYDWVERKKLPTLGVLFLLGASLSSAWNVQVLLLGAGAFAVLATNFANAFMSLLGRHSYAIYLSHFALVPAISAWLPLDLILLFALVTAISLTLSYCLIEPLIERRFNRFGHGLAARVRQPRIATTAA